MLLFALLKGRSCTVGTCSSGTGNCEACRWCRGTVAGLEVFRDATVGDQLVAEGCAKLWEL